MHAVASATERHAGDERTLSRPFAGNIKPLLANTITRYTFIKLNFPCFTVVKLRALGGFLLFALASSPHCYPHRKEIFVLDWTCCIYRSIRASERQSLIKRGLQVGTVQPTYPASPLAYINSPHHRADRKTKTQGCIASPPANQTRPWSNQWVGRASFFFRCPFYLN